MLKRVTLWMLVVLMFSGGLSQSSIDASTGSEASSSNSPSSSSVSTTESTTSSPSESTPSSASSSSESTTASPTVSSTESTTASPASSSTESSTASSASSATESTSSSAQSSSTASPTGSSTTTVGPSTTPAPIPKPDKGSWVVKDDNNSTCIRANMAALFIIPLDHGNVEYIALSVNASDTDSDCTASNTTQKLVLTDVNYKFTLEFEKDDKQVYVKDIEFSYTLGQITGDVHSKENVTFFSVKNGNSYLCNANKNISLENVTLSVTDLHIQAFGKKDNTGFTVAEECDADDKVNQIVPIAVGCALAALVVVVLIAYLVGRRRSRQKGYQSV